ncbi:unnamed protein product, partial [Mycena citricolor]
HPIIRSLRSAINLRLRAQHIHGCSCLLPLLACSPSYIESLFHSVFNIVSQVDPRKLEHLRHDRWSEPRDIRGHARTSLAHHHDHFCAMSASFDAQAFVRYSLGGRDLSTNLCLILQGVLLGQFARYISNGFHRSDPTIMRVWLVGLLFLTLGKNLSDWYVTHRQNTTRFLDASGVLMDYISLKGQASYLVNVVLVFYVQIFFCWRLWTLCRRIWLPSLIALSFVGAAIAGILSVPATHAKYVLRWSAACYIIYFAGDLILCASMMYHLLISTDARSSQLFRDTANVLARIARITIQSALPAVICALVDLIASQINQNYYALDVATTLTIITTHVLPMCYALSSLWTLNSRMGWRRAGETRDAASSRGCSVEAP